MLKKLGSDKIIAMYTMALIKDNSSLYFLPNYAMLKERIKIDKVNMWTWHMTENYIMETGSFLQSFTECQNFPIIMTQQ